jgi:DNA-binding CsgD family transcriptional regulator
MLATHENSDLVQVLEALYEVEQPRTSWLRGVIKAAGSTLDRGAGVAMILYDVSGDAPKIDEIDAINVDASCFAMGIDTHNDAGFAESVLTSYRNNVCATAAEYVRDPQVLRAMRQCYARVGVQDQVLINGANSSGIGCALYVLSKTHLRLTAVERDLMTRIATHLSAAYRLQRLLEALNEGDGLIDALLNIDGQVEHAEVAASSYEARRSLTTAVKLREWARASSGRGDPWRATSAWKPMVEGRWSLVDGYEPNGRRYIAARANEPLLIGPPMLSPRERQVAYLAGLGRSNKVIAYELGLAHATVRVLVARAAYKLGVRTRAEMLKRMHAHDVSPTTSFKGREGSG